MNPSHLSEEMLLRVEGLTKTFAGTQRFFEKTSEAVHAVSKIDLVVGKRETLGLVGESGCGKSTLARCILRLLEPDAGKVFFHGEDLLGLAPEALRERRKHLQMIFQDPYSSLNPRMSVRQMLAEPLTIHRLARGRDLSARVEQLLIAVGLRAEAMNRYPHEFSGGQRQRLGIARALAVEPELIVADEPVSALDVSVQAQILNLLLDLQEQRGLSYLLITHDLKVVERVSDRVAVMYLGKIVEETRTDELIRNPLHPYTQALLSAVPRLSSSPGTKRQRIGGEPPSPRHPPSGCAFHPRCPLAVDRCKKETPLLEEKKPGHRVACFMVS